MPTVLITGANRGIGLELTNQYLADGWDVLACCRSPERATVLTTAASERLQIEQLDVTDHSSVDALAGRLTGRAIDVLINNAGIIGPVPVAEHIDRQHFGSIDYGVWEQVLRTNTFGPVKMAEAFLPNIQAGTQKKIVTLSSTVGSIVERDTPAIAYATSKSAINKAMTLLAVLLRPHDIIVSLVCPGYVKTRMDFGGADVEIPQSAAGIRKLINEYTMADTGTFRRFNGETVAW